MNFFKNAMDDLKEKVEDKIEETVQEVISGGDDAGAEAETGAEKEGNGEEAAESAEKAGGSSDEFDEQAKLSIPGLVRMISGCHDTQTSADVSDVSSFELPEDAGPGGAGGACTNSLISSLHESEDRTWVQLLDSMRGILGEKGYTQIPQLSSSRKEDIQNEKFNIMNANPTGKKKALLIGINYVGQRGELRGCHNDVLSLKAYLLSKGFEESEMKILMDDGENTNPTAENILQAFDWLVDDAEEGDSLWFSYSGHGGYVKETGENKDEADGRDETLVPVDFQSAGQIIDDLIFKELVMPVPAGCQLTCLMDCCHSGTVLDLPYIIKASEHLEGTDASMSQNPGFSFQKLFNVAKKLYEMKNSGASNTAMASHAAKELVPMFLGKAGSSPSGGLSNLMALASGGGSGGSSSGLPSLPF